MKVAIIDHMVNPGGGSRVLRNLLPAIRQLRPDWELVLFANLDAMKREGLLEEFASLIEIRKLKSVQLANIKFFGIKGAKVVITFFQRKFKTFLSFFPLFFSGAIHREIQKISKDFDLIFCPWPFLVECPESLSIPVVAIFHDFNFRYYFNGPTFHPTQLEYLEKEIPRWLNTAVPVVSTYFMKKELEKFYPRCKCEVNVIHLSSLCAMTKRSFSEARQIVSSFGITDPYVLYPTNTSTHKNIGNLLSAFYLLKKQHPHLKLVLAGFGTEVVNGNINPVGLERSMNARDVIGLGYVSNSEIDALIQCAQVVVSTSLYEAGCGPGLDAWNLGVPVAMSNIAPFVEHIEIQGVRAQVFDPKSPIDIAEKIDWILSHPQQAKEDARISQEHLSVYDWCCVAKKYIQVFEAAVHG